MNNCVAMCLLTMRSVLGYKGHNFLLEKMFVTDEVPVVKDIARIVAAAFPGRYIVMVSEVFDKSKFEPLPGSVDFLGKSIPDDLKEDAYLWAFSYDHESTKGGHTVIGWPVIYGDTRLRWAIGVQIGRGAIAKSQDLEALIQNHVQNGGLVIGFDDSFWFSLAAYLEELQTRVELGARFGTFEPLPKMKKVEQPQPSRIVKSIREGPYFIDKDDWNG